MEGNVRVLNRHLKRFDDELYCQRTGAFITIYRNAKRVQVLQLADGSKITYLHRAPAFILALTDNGLLNGKPCNWGIEPIINRLQYMDSWSRKRLFEEQDKLIEAEEKSKERSLSNKIENFAYETRDVFAKDADQYNFANVSKQSIFKKKELENGYCK